MSRRLSILATVILLLFVLIAAQSANLQFFRASALDTSPLNPRNSTVSDNTARGEIIAADGTVLAESVPTGKNGTQYRRIYPLGALTSQVVGFTSPFYGAYFLESQYNSLLTSHTQPAQSVAQVLAPSQGADSIVLTLEPALQRAIARALAGRDGAAVVLDPQNGDILGMYSNPTYNPNPLTSTDKVAAARVWHADTKKNAEGFPDLGNLAVQQIFPPGSTSKVVTTASVVIFKPQLLLKHYPWKTVIPLPDSNKTFHNYHYEGCGGTIAEMLPPSCDTGFALVGLDVGGQDLATTAAGFGYNQVPPIDLPGTVASNYPTAAALADNLPGVAYSAIGQQNVSTSALMNALIAGAVGNGGVMMTPHLLNYVLGPDGQIIKRYKDHVWKTPLTKVQAAEIVPLMVAVAQHGTAYGVFPASEDVAAKTGTAEVGTATNNTDDWLIAFAPSSDPTLAVAVVLPNQVPEATGAIVAGPVIRCVMAAAFDVQMKLPVPTSCPT